MECKDCRFDKGSYHCLDCSNNDLSIEELKSFCPYCNYDKGSENCNNCVWI